jgi:hypothetical protein
MMKTLTLLVLFFGPVAGFSQSIGPSVIASSGQSFSNAQISMNWTIGEPVIDTYFNSLILTQGFQQVFDFTIGIDGLTMDSLELSVYPNPVADFLFIKFPDRNLTYPSAFQVNFSVLNMAGSEISQGTCRLWASRTRMDLQGLSPANYIIIISFEDQKRSFIITKL